MDKTHNGKEMISEDGKRREEDSYEKYSELIKVLGEKKIEEAFFVMGHEKFSFATIMKMIRNERIYDWIKNGEACKKISSTFHISRMTVYRHLKSRLKK